VDIAIAKSVEKEVQDASHIGTKSEASNNITVKQPKVGAAKGDSPSATVSALDHVGVSSVDLDITSSVEKEAESVALGKEQDISEKLADKKLSAGPQEKKGINASII